MKKITIWRNPTPLDPRWDAEIVYDDDRHERIIRVTEEQAIGLIKLTFRGEDTDLKNPKGE